MKPIVSILCLAVLVLSSCGRSTPEQAAVEPPPTEVETATGSAGAEAPARPTEPAAPPASATAGLAGKIYRHPTGVEFWYPSEWQVEMSEGIVQMAPPGAGQGENAAEVYLVTGEDISGEGVTRANDPAVIEKLDQDLAQAMGAEIGVAFQRSGQPRDIEGSPGNGGGVEVDWVAQTEAGPYTLRAYFCIVDSYGLMVAGLAPTKDLDARRDLMLKIYRSFGVGRGKIDDRLVGTWKLVSTGAITNNSPFETAWSRAQAVSETASSLTFHADGTWTRSDRSLTLVGASGIWLEDKSESSARGKWNADGQALFMLWESKSFADFRYRIGNNQLRIAIGNKGEVWERQ